MIKLNDQVKDIVTGFKGMVTARVEYLNGCIKFAVQPKINKGGEIPGDEWIDEEQLEMVVSAKKRKTTKKGGPVRSLPR